MFSTQTWKIIAPNKWCSTSHFIVFFKDKRISYIFAIGRKVFIFEVISWIYRGYIVAAEMEKSAKHVKQITDEINQIVKAIGLTTNKIDDSLDKLK